MTEMITARGLVKRYKQVTALDGLDLSAPAGTVLGLLGPNGAGKSTAVRILSTLLRPDSGEVIVAGVDVLARPDAARSRIGLSGQSAAVDEHLTGFENLDMVGRLYGLPRRYSRARARELLEQFSLTDAGDRPSKTYSGGMRRRLDLAAALVAAPPVIVLDEPTTGLDPRSRNEMWAVIRDLVAAGTTMLLTTQYLEEADRLADDIVVIDHGRSIARGTAEELKDRFGADRIELAVADPADLPGARRVLEQVAGTVTASADAPRALSAPAPGRVGTLTETLRRLDAERIDVVDIGLRRPTLDDVFLALTGRTAEDAAEPDPGADSPAAPPAGAERKDDHR